MITLLKIAALFTTIIAMFYAFGDAFDGNMQSTIHNLLLSFLNYVAYCILCYSVKEEMKMVYKNEKSIYVKCDCGCSGIHIDKLEYKDEPTEYILSISASCFYTEQDGIFSKLKGRLKFIWYILRHGTHRFFEIVISPEDFEKFKELLIKYK